MVDISVSMHEHHRPRIHTHRGSCKPEGRRKGDPDRAEPEQRQTTAAGEARDGARDGVGPHGGDGAGEGGYGDEAEHDDEHEEPCPEGLHEPRQSIASMT